MEKPGTQRDKYIAALKRTDTLLEYAVQNGMAEESDRLRGELRQLASMGDENHEGLAI